MKLRSNKKISVFSILIVAILCITIGYAAINSVVLNVIGTVEAEVPKKVFITNVEYVSDIDAQKDTSTILNYSGTTMQSKISLSKTNALSEIVYKISVYNNSSEEATFLDVIYSKDNYDNENIVYEILDTGFKQEQKIAAKEKKDIYIKFKYKDGVVAENNILNSYIKFSIGKPNMLNTTSNTGDYFGAVTRSSIEKISFELGETPENVTKTFDASASQDGSITGYVTDVDNNGMYEITFSSNDIIFANINSKYLFYGLTKLTNIEFNNFRTTETTDMSYMFYNSRELISLDVSKFDTSKVTSMNYMFYNCSDLTSLNVSKFDTSKVTSMGSMFSSCSGLTSLDVSKFDTASVTNMQNMFNHCSGLTSLDVSKFDTASVTNMQNMFDTCSKLTSLNVSKFDTSNVTSMSYMFDTCGNLTVLDVSSFDTSNVTDMSYMFSGCSGLINIDASNFDTSKVTDMSSMFELCGRLTTIYASDKFNTDKVTYSFGMFDGCSALVGGNGTNYNSSYTDKTYARLDTAGAPGYFTGKIAMLKVCPQDTFWGVVDKFEVSTVSFEDTIKNAPSTATDVSELGDGSILCWRDGSYGSYALHVASNKKIYANPDSSYLFYGVLNLQNISFDNFNTSKTENMSHMFDGDMNEPLNEISSRSIELLEENSVSLDISTFDTSNVTDMSYMFAWRYELTSIDVSSFNTSKVTDMSYMFLWCDDLTNLDVSNFNTSNVTDMSYMFYHCGLTNLDVSNFNTSNVTDMSSMFYYCGLTNLDVSKFDTSNVTTMSYMFSGCSGLINIDASNFDTSKVTDMSSMFEHCGRLTTIYASDKFNTDKVTNSSYMFSSCTSLVGGNGTKYNSSYIDKTYARLDITGTPGYFSEKKGYLKLTSSETSSSSTFLGMGTRDNITKVIFENTTKNVPSNAIDVSAASDRSIVGWLNGTEAHIASDVSIYANKDSSYLFARLTKCTAIENLNLLNTRETTNMSFMFTYCNSLTSLDVSKFDTSNVTTMTDMFMQCSSIVNLDLSNFNTSNVTSMSSMFYYCSKLTNLDLSNFNTSKVTTMSDMFGNCSKLTSLDVSNFDTSNVSSMGYMFYYCSTLTNLDLSKFNTSNATNMSEMFRACNNLTNLDLSNFNTAKVTNMSSMFLGCSNLKTIYASSTFTTSAVTSSSSMFSNCTSLVGGNGTKYNSSYTDKTYARIDKSGTPGYFTKGKEKKFLRFCPEDTFWNGTQKFYISEVIFEDNMKNVPSSATDISESSDGSIRCWEENSKLHIASNDYIYANPDSSYLFYLLGAEKWNDETKITNLELLNTSEVTDMSQMFASNVSSLNLNNFNTSKVTNMEKMFYDSYFLTSLDLSKFDTSNVTNMGYMFSGCSGLTSIDASNFDTSNVTLMSGMFDYCSSLTTVYASDKFNTNKVTYSSGMFYYCSALVGGNGTKYNSSYTDKTYARIDSSGTPGYFTLKK